MLGNKILHVKDITIGDYGIFLELPGERLSHYIDRKINPDANFLSSCGANMKNIVEFMHKIMPYSVAETIKGGSLGKGTAVRDKSDIDVLFAVNDVKSIDELKKKLPQIKHDLHTALCCGMFCSSGGAFSPEEKAARREAKKNRPFKVSDIRRTPFTVSFTMTHPDGTSQNVDLIVVPKMTKHPGKFSSAELKNVYQKMKLHPEYRDYYGKCLSPVQVEFVKCQPEIVKRAIRLTKYWAKTYEHKLSSYAIELLGIKTYDELKQQKPRVINEEKIAEGIFNRLRNCKNMKVEWNNYYNLGDYGRPDGPYIMDPANPYHNLFSKNTETYWIRKNETERIVHSNPDITRLESDAAATLQSLRQNFKF